MQTLRFPFRISDSVVSFVKATIVVIIFSPWLVIVYPLIASYTANLQAGDQDAIRGFIEWFGTAYSFFLALAVVNVWSQFETVEREFDRELDALAILLQTVKFTKASSKWKQWKLDRFKEDVERDIEDYVNHVINFHKLEIKDHPCQREGDRILESIGERVSSLTSGKVVPEPFIYELFHSLNEAIDVRGDRISHSKPYTPFVVKIVSLAASVIWLASFLGLVIYDRWVAGLIIGAVAFVIIMVLVIFFDLGEPFGGIWKVNLEEWKGFAVHRLH